MIVAGRVWKLTDRSRAIDLLPARHDQLAMAGRWNECVDHVLEDVRPDARGAFRPGDIIIGGQDLGGGHAHYHRGAVMTCKQARFGALLAETVNPLFLRAAIDAGVLAWAYPDLSGFVEDGDHLQLDVGSGMAVNQTTKTSRRFPPVTQLILDLLDAGGTQPWALRRVGVLQRTG